MLPTTLFETRYELDLDGTEVHRIYVGPCHQLGDAIVHVAKERVIFETDLTSLDAAKRIEFGPYREWRAPAPLFMNVERAYRELQNKPFDAHWDTVATFDAVYEVATARGLPIEFERNECRASRDAALFHGR